MTTARNAATRNNGDMFASLDLELQILRRLSDHRRRPPIFDGATDQAERCRRLRAAILDAGCDVVIFGATPEGKPETYAAAFERLYGEPLHPKTKHKVKTDAVST